MIKLNYNATYTFNSTDIRDLADSEPITYECWINRQPGWTDTAKKFLDSGGESTDLAIRLVSLSLVTVSQSGEAWPIDGETGVREIMTAVDATNPPGAGAVFVRALAMSIFDQQLAQEQVRLKNSATPLTPAANGVETPQPAGQTA